MSLYKDASLVMLPSAYRDGRLYSIRPIPEYGSEIVTNGTFDTDSDWTKGGGATISGGKANIIGDGSAFGYVEQTNVFENGKTYRITLNAVINSGGGLNVKYGVGFSSNIGSITKSGFYSFKYTAGLSGPIIIGRSTGGVAYDSSVDNVSVKEVLVNDGDFDFSRGSNLAATRVDVNGLIEKGRENYILHSNAITTSPWGGPRIFTQTQGHTGYDGSNDAWLMIPNSTSGTHYKVQSVSTTSGVNTISVYAKAAGYNYITIRDDSSGNSYGRFDLATGVTSITGSNAITSKIESVGNDWWRCSLTYLETATGNILFYVNNAYNYAGVYVGDEVSGVYFQDFQVEQGLVATDYIETGASTAQAGILEDMPRLDYSGGASCPALLLEPQRTNSLHHSEYFDSYYDTDGQFDHITITNNATTSPEGLKNAAKLAGNNTSKRPINAYIGRGGVVSPQPYVSSVFAKAGEYDYAVVTIGSYSSGFWASFNLDTGVVDTQPTAANTTASIEDYGNGWYRCMIHTTNSAGAEGIYFTPSVDGTLNTFYTSTTDGVYFWGVQVEAGSYPTSYIPTYGASVTRSADDCEKTSATSLIGQSQGTLFTQVGDFPQEVNGRIFAISDGSSNNYITIIRSGSNNNFALYVNTLGVTQVAYAGSGSLNDNSKIAVGYANNDFVVYVNGTQVHSDSSASIPACSSVWIGQRENGSRTYIAGGGLKQAVLFKTRLTNAELASLTTL